MGGEEREGSDETDPGAGDGGIDRRRLLGYGGLAAILGLAGVGIGLRALDGDDGSSKRTPTPDTSTSPRSAGSS